MRHYKVVVNARNHAYVRNNVKLSEATFRAKEWTFAMKK